jgi:hypothetical protein
VEGDIVPSNLQLECALTTPKDFIARANVHKVFIVVLHTLQVTHAMNLPKVKPKTIFYISCDHLAPNMAIILSIHALQIFKGM